VKLPLLHVIATDDVVEATGFDPLAAELVAAGRDTIALHLRLGRAGSRDFCDRAERLAAAARASGAWCAVNGRVDVALVAGAQAVQLGSGALPVEAVRRIAGTRLAIGASVHSAEEGRTRARDGADYLVAGHAPEPHAGRSRAGDVVRNRRCSGDRDRRRRRDQRGARRGGWSDRGRSDPGSVAGYGSGRDGPAPDRSRPPGGGPTGRPEGLPGQRNGRRKGVRKRECR